MRAFKILLAAILLTGLIFGLTSCGGGGGGGSIISGTIVNEAAAPLPNGQYSVQQSGTIGSIDPNGKFAASTGFTAGNLILTNYSQGFRFRRVPFDLTATASLNLGNVLLPDDALSKGWGAYRAGDLNTAQIRFNEHISASGRDIAEAHHGLGWALLRVGDSENAISSLKASLGAGFDADGRTALATAYLHRTTAGTYSIGEAISNLDLAIGSGGYYMSQPMHDNISEDDLVAFRSMLNLLDGRVQAAVADRNTALGSPDAKLNDSSLKMLTVVDFFLGG